MVALTPQPYSMTQISKQIVREWRGHAQPENSTPLTRLLPPGQRQEERTDWKGGEGGQRGAKARETRRPVKEKPSIMAWGLFYREQNGSI